MLNAMMKKKKTRTERIADFKEEASTIVNLRFTTDELVKLNALARARRERTRDVIYPLILHYLNDCAQPEDRPIVIRAVEVVKDQYWGTEEELNHLIKTSDGVMRKRPLHGFTFEYWAKETNSLPSITEVVRFIAEANTWPIDADSVFDSLGGRVRPSKANAMAKLSKRFKEFFTAEELKELNKLL